MRNLDGDEPDWQYMVLARKKGENSVQFGVFMDYDKAKAMQEKWQAKGRFTEDSGWKIMIDSPIPELDQYFI